MTVYSSLANYLYNILYFLNRIKRITIIKNINAKCTSILNPYNI